MDKEFEYDAFISYKRKGGSGWAELLWVTLTRLAGKSIYIDHNMAGGTAHPLISELRGTIDKSMNVIVIVFDGIQDVIKPEEDVFLEEVRYACRKKKNVIPFYVDGLSSKLIQTESRFSDLPDDLKKIISTKHSDISFDIGYNWLNSLTKSFLNEREIRLKKEYLIRIQTDRDTSILIWGTLPIDVKAGEIFEHWLANSSDLHMDLMTESESHDERIKYSIHFDSYSKGGIPFVNAFRQYHYLRSSRDRVQLIPVRWSQIEEEQQKESMKSTDIL